MLPFLDAVDTFLGETLALLGEDEEGRDDRTAATKFGGYDEAPAGLSRQRIDLAVVAGVVARVLLRPVGAHVAPGDSEAASRLTVEPRRWRRAAPSRRPSAVRSFAGPG